MLLCGEGSLHAGGHEGDGRVSVYALVREVPSVQQPTPVGQRTEKGVGYGARQGAADRKNEIVINTLVVVWPCFFFSFLSGLLLLTKFVPGLI